MTETIEDQARAITKRVNDRIQSEGANWSGYEYRAKAEQVAEEEIPPSWEWTLSEGLGVLPVVVLLRHDPRRD